MTLHPGEPDAQTPSGAAQARAHLMRFVKFGVVGGSGVVVNLGVARLVFWALSALVASQDTRQLAANVCGVVVSIFTNFLLNDTWTWGDRLKGGRRQWVARVLRYYATCSIAGLVQVTAASLSYRMIWRPLGLDVWGVDPALELSVLVGIACGMAINFPISHLWAFKDDEPT